MAHILDANLRFRRFASNARFRNGTAAFAMAAGLAVTAPATAQTAYSNTRDGQVESTQDALNAEIIVTAQRRDERLIDVPISISVLSKDTLDKAGVSNTTELALVTPGLQINNSGGFVTTALRGISSEVIGPGSDNNVAMYVDGVYMPSKRTGVFEFPDIESIEVLKGPQGTLYGRNATGGALLFKTADPSFELGGRASASYGSYNNIELKGVLTGPLIDDKLAMSVAGYYEKSDGQTKNIFYNDRKAGLESWLVRGKLMATPSDSVKLVLTGYYSDRFDKGTLAWTVVDNNTDGILIDPNALVTSRPRDVAHNDPTSLRNKTLGLNFRAEIETPWGELASTTGYTDIDSVIIADADNTNISWQVFVVTQPARTFTQDISFAAKPIGPVSLLAGLTYFRDSGKIDPVDVIITDLPVFFIYAKVNTEAVAAFVEADTKITDKLSVILGLRTTYEKKKLFGSAGSVREAAFPKVGEESWWNTTTRVAVRYRLGDNTNIFASYAGGFKSGNFNSAALNPRPVDPEFIDSFEVGIKSSEVRSLSFGASAFYYNYKNIQVTTFNGVFSEGQNAATAEVYGLDLDVSYRPVEDLTLQIAFSPLHAKFKSFRDGSILIPNVACPAPFEVCGNLSASADLSGNRLVRAPKYSGNVSVNYMMHLPASTLNFYANLYFTDRFAWEIGNRIIQPSYQMLSANVTWRLEESPWSVTLWGKNLTDEDYAAAGGMGANGDGLLWAAPATFGVRLAAEF